MSVATTIALGAISDHAQHLTRTFLSPAQRRAAEQILAWMDELGMETAHAADGTLRGILPGSNPEAAPLLLGSHYDTVIDAGKYDGPLGIVSALAALEQVQPLPFPVHVLAFSDEEGVRFQTTYLGSRSILGPLDAITLASRDADGQSLAEVLEKEGWHDGASIFHYPAGSVRGYVELHIEQGRVLEDLGQPACVVSSIAGQVRLAITLIGHADHAGTTPMNLRRDALAGAAACILDAEKLAQSREQAVITVGKIGVQPGASNSIPQRADFTVDLRHADDGVRAALMTELEKSFREIADQRALLLEWRVVQQSAATPCDEVLSARLLDSLQQVTGSRIRLVSGAGHDGVALAEAMPIAMLFIRCREGLSHHPDEYASPEDIGIGVKILAHFLTHLPA
jgi:allantoate deiminase